MTAALQVTYVGGRMNVNVLPGYKTDPSDGDHLQTMRPDGTDVSQPSILAAVADATVRGGDAFGWTGHDYAEDAFNALVVTDADQEDLMLALIKPESERGAAFLSLYRSRIEARATGCVK